MAKRAKFVPRAYDKQNRWCARVILADPDQFGGDDSLPARWARRVLAITGCHPEQAVVHSRPGGTDHAPAALGWSETEGRQMNQMDLFAGVA